MTVIGEYSVLVIAFLAGLLSLVGIRFVSQFAERKRVDRRLEEINSERRARREASKRSIKNLNALVGRARKVREASEQTKQAVETRLSLSSSDERRS